MKSLFIPLFLMASHGFIVIWFQVLSLGILNWQWCFLPTSSWNEQLYSIAITQGLHKLFPTPACTPQNCSDHTASPVLWNVGCWREVEVGLCKTPAWWNACSCSLYSLWIVDKLGHMYTVSWPSCFFILMHVYQIKYNYMLVKVLKFW